MRARLVEAAGTLKGMERGLHTRAMLPIFASTAALALLSFLGSAWLQSILRTDDVGLYTLVGALVAMIGPLAALGQGGQIIRLYGRGEAGSFDWPRDVARIMRFALGVVVALCVGVVFLYESLDPWVVAFVGALSLSLTLIGLIVSVLRSHREYLASSALLRGPYALAFVVAMAAQWLARRELIFVLAATTVGFVAVAFAGVRVSLARIPVGKRAMSHGEGIEGLAYVLWTMGDIVGGYGEVALAGAVLPPASIALYGVGRNIVRVFDLARASIDVALPTEIQKRGRMPLLRFLVPVGCLAALLVMLHAAVGPFVLRVLFGGRFDAAAPIVSLLALGGGLRVVHALAHSALIVVEDPRALRRYLAAGLGVELASLPLTLVMTVNLGIYGTSLAVCISWLLRNLVAYGSYMTVKPQRI